MVGSFAAGAALALAPLAAADPDPAAVVDITPTFTSEVASLNSLFQTYALFAGVPSTDYAVGPQGLDFIVPADIAKDAPASGTPTILDYELFGVNPFSAGVASDPGAANEFNGALVNFDNAYNVELFSSLNPTAPIDSIPMADLFGSSSSISEALAFGTASGAATDFYNDAIGDLSGFFQTNLTFLDIPEAATTMASAF